MTLFATLKQNSHRALRGHWGGAILGMLVLGGVSLLLYCLRGYVVHFFAPQTVPDPLFGARHGFEEYFFQQYAQISRQELAILGGAWLLNLLIVVPLGLGVTCWYWALVRGREFSLGEMFHFFGSGRGYLRAIGLHLQLLVRSFAWAVVFFLIPAAIWGSSVYLVNRTDGAVRGAGALLSLGMVFGAVLFLLAAVFYLVLLSKYLLAFYLVCEDESLSVRRAIKLSCAYTRGYRFSLFWYQLSFIGWFLLCVFVFPALFVYPYFNTALAMYASFLIEKNRFTPPNPTMEYRVGQTGTQGEQTGAEPPVPPVEPALPEEPEEEPLPTWEPPIGFGFPDSPPGEREE